MIEALLLAVIILATGNLIYQLRKKVKQQEILINYYSDKLEYLLTNKNNNSKK